MIKDNIYIYSFYRFKALKKVSAVKIELSSIIKKNSSFRTILISSEGINGSISGNSSELDFFIKKMKVLLKIRKLSLKVSKNSFIPFNRFKIKIKNKLASVTF